MAGRFTTPTPAEYDSSGNPLAGGKLNFYETGTSTPLDTYSDDDLSVANANPVVADSAGRWGDIFLKAQDYKVVLTDSADVTIKTWDPVRAAEPTSTAVISKTTTYTITASDNGKLIKADATGGAFTITLPAAATAGDGFEVAVKKIDSSSSAVTLDADGSETIDGDTDVSLPNQYDVVQVRSDGSAWIAIVLPLVRQNLPLPRGAIDGLVLSNNGTDADHDIDISAGMCRDGADGVNMILSAAITKRIDAAWAVGDGNGGIDTGSVTTDTWYHVWLIRRSDTGVVDALFSTSATAPTMPSNYDQKLRIGAVLTDGSSNIIGFSQVGDEFLWDTPVNDENSTAPGTSAVTTALTVPTGVKVRALIGVAIEDSSAASDTYALLTSPDQSDTVPSATVNDLWLPNNGSQTAASVRTYVRTDTSAQVRYRLSSSTAGHVATITTHGWVDSRGKDA